MGMKKQTNGFSNEVVEWDEYIHACGVYEIWV